MDLLILGFWILFWCVLYFAQGRHDVAFLKETQLIKEEVTPAAVQKIVPEMIKSELNWKFWQMIENLMIKIALTVLIFALRNNIMAALLLFTLSIFIRWSVHDIVVAIGLGKGTRHIGPDWIWTDRVLWKLREKGINQYIVKLIPIVILIVAYCICVK